MHQARSPLTYRTVPALSTAPPTRGWPGLTGVGFSCDTCGRPPKRRSGGVPIPHPTMADPDRWGSVIHVCSSCAALGLTRRQLKDAALARWARLGQRFRGLRRRTPPDGRPLPAQVAPLRRPA